MSISIGNCCKRTFFSLFAIIPYEERNTIRICGNGTTNNEGIKNPRRNGNKNINTELFLFSKKNYNLNRFIIWKNIKTLPAIQRMCRRNEIWIMFSRRRMHFVS